jgi:heat shock protein HtpX
MIRALRSLEKGTDRIRSATAQPQTAHMYVAAPFSGGGFGKFFMTHPPIPDRIEALRQFA